MVKQQEIEEVLTELQNQAAQYEEQFTQEKKQLQEDVGKITPREHLLFRKGYWKGIKAVIEQKG